MAFRVCRRGRSVCDRCRLSAFFSGSETGFYRVSFLRLSIDAYTGTPSPPTDVVRQHPDLRRDHSRWKQHRQLLTTLAIGLGAGAILDAEAPLLTSLRHCCSRPVIFLFGELMPKNLYFRSPTTLLRRSLRWFDLCYRLFIPMSVPLVWMTRLIERLGAG